MTISVWLSAEFKDLLTFCTLKVSSIDSSTSVTILSDTFSYVFYIGMITESEVDDKFNLSCDILI